MTQVLVKRPENQIRPLSVSDFQLLMLCDGETDLSGIPLTSEMESSLSQYQDTGLILSSPDPRPLDPDQVYRFYHNRYVNSVFWSITGRCNFRCRHCFMDAPDAALGELSTEEALRLIDQMADCGVLRVDITGGEPLVRNDFWQLVDRILSYKMVVGKIYSNGWLLNETFLDELERRNMKPDISVSFDGVGWHDWMRGIPGAEQATLKALALCHARGLHLDVEMCIHRGNRDMLPQNVEALRQVGVEDLKVSNVSMTELWTCRNEGNALTQQEYTEAMIPYIGWYYQAGRPIARLTLSNVAVLYRDQPAYTIPAPHDGSGSCLNCHLCNSARFSCYITPEGRLLPCMPMTSSPDQNLFPKVQDIGLRQGLSDSYYMQFVSSRVKDLLAANAECAACEYRYRCGGGCRATALLEGDHALMGCDRIMCLMWKGGYVDRIQAAIAEAEAKYGEAAAQT